MEIGRNFEGWGGGSKAKTEFPEGWADHGGLTLETDTIYGRLMLRRGFQEDPAPAGVPAGMLLLITPYFALIIS